MKKSHNIAGLLGFALLMVLLPSKAGAQWGVCIDETRVQPLYQCHQPMFEPVCGCDGYTYRNVCQAYNNYGVSYWTGGVCSGFFLDFYPNPVSNMNPMNLNIMFEDNVYSSLNIRIIDYFGKVVYQYMYGGVNRIETQLDMKFLREGIYIIVAESGHGQYWFEKFIKT